MNAFETCWENIPIIDIISFSFFKMVIPRCFLFVWRVQLFSRENWYWIFLFFFVVIFKSFIGHWNLVISLHCIFINFNRFSHTAIAYSWDICVAMKIFNWINKNRLCFVCINGSMVHSFYSFSSFQIVSSLLFTSSFQSLTLSLLFVSSVYICLEKSFILNTK